MSTATCRSGRRTLTATTASPRWRGGSRLTSSRRSAAAAARARADQEMPEASPWHRRYQPGRGIVEQNETCGGGQPVEDRVVSCRRAIDRRGGCSGPPKPAPVHSPPPPRRGGPRRARDRPEGMPMSRDTRRRGSRQRPADADLRPGPTLRGQSIVTFTVRCAGRSAVVENPLIRISAARRDRPRQGDEGEAAVMSELALLPLHSASCPSIDSVRRERPGTAAGDGGRGRRGGPPDTGLRPPVPGTGRPGMVLVQQLTAPAVTGRAMKSFRRSCRQPASALGMRLRGCARRGSAGFRRASFA
jgi:hypothetical protein